MIGLFMMDRQTKLLTDMSCRYDDNNWEFVRLVSKIIGSEEAGEKREKTSVVSQIYNIFVGI